MRLVYGGRAADVRPNARRKQTRKAVTKRQADAIFAVVDLRGGTKYSRSDRIVFVSSVNRALFTSVVPVVSPFSR